MACDTETLLRRTVRRLTRAGLVYGHGLPDAESEALFFLAVATRRRSFRFPDTLSEPQAARFETLVHERIAQRLPAAYVAGSAWYEGRWFLADARALVPRSLLGYFLRSGLAPWVADPSRVRRVLEVGVGGGSLAVLAARAFAGARVDATDLSPQALALAKANVARARLDPRVRLVKAQGFPETRARYDLIFSNPPYATEGEYRRLGPEYRHEPKSGLVAPARGLGVIFDLLDGAARRLTRDGLLLVETGNRATDLARLMPFVPWVWLTHESGDESVFLLSREALVSHARAIASAYRRLLAA